MKHLLAVLIILSLNTPAWAQLPSGFEPVEKPLIEKQKLEEDMTRDFQKQQGETAKPAEKKGSNWWKWGLGILVVGAVAAAAGGGGGGGGGTGSDQGGTVNVGW